MAGKGKDSPIFAYILVALMVLAYFWLQGGGQAPSMPSLPSIPSISF